MTCQFFFPRLHKQFSCATCIAYTSYFHHRHSFPSLNNSLLFKHHHSLNIQLYHTSNSQQFKTTQTVTDQHRCHLDHSLFEATIDGNPGNNFLNLVFAYFMIQKFTKKLLSRSAHLFWLL